MPCSDNGWVADAATTYRQMQDRNDALARMLCGLCKASTPESIAAVRGLPKWWKRHQIEDAERAADEDE